jgi:hypothetical protein
MVDAAKACLTPGVRVSMNRPRALLGGLLVVAGCASQSTPTARPQAAELRDRTRASATQDERARPAWSVPCSDRPAGSAPGETSPATPRGSCHEPLASTADEGSATEPPDSADQALRAAIEVGELATVSELLGSGVDANTILDSDGTTPLMLAAEQDRAQIAELLIEHGARVNERRTDGESALTLAAWYGNVDVVRALLEHGADVNAETASGDTALSMADQDGYREIAKLLREKGARDKPPRSVTGQKQGAVTVLPDVRRPKRNEPLRIQAVVRRQYGKFRLCYELGLHGCPNLEGRITIRFVIGLDGRVTKVRDAGSDITDREVVECVLRAVSGFVFPKPEKPITVQYPIMFSPG